MMMMSSGNGRRGGEIEREETVELDALYDYLWLVERGGLRVCLIVFRQIDGRPFSATLIRYIPLLSVFINPGYFHVCYWFYIHLILPDVHEKMIE